MIEKLLISLVIDILKEDVIEVTKRALIGSGANTDLIIGNIRNKVEFNGKKVMERLSEMLMDGEIDENELRELERITKEYQ